MTLGRRSGELRAASDLTERDARIVRFLQEDGRCPVVRIAEELDMPSRAISKRIAELRQTGVIDITAVTDPKALGLESAALVGLKLDPSETSPDAVVPALWNIPYIDYLSVTGGRYDVIAEVVCREPAELLRIVQRQIVPAAHPRLVEIFPYLSLYYQRFRYLSGNGELVGLPESAGEQGVRAGSVQFDVMDQRIIAELNRDGRTPFDEIRKRVGVSESQVRRRVNRMVDGGGLRIMAMANPASLGYKTLAWLAITVAPGAAIRDVAQALSTVRAVIYIVVPSGRFHVFADVIARDEEDLLRILDEDIRATHGVESVEAWIHLDLHWRPLRPILEDASQ